MRYHRFLSSRGEVFAWKMLPSRIGIWVMAINLALALVFFPNGEGGRTGARKVRGVSGV